MPDPPMPGESAITLAAGALEARIDPRFGMLTTSLRHRGEEVLRRVDRLADAAARGSTAGIPLLHPWANRLASTTYEVAGQTVHLDPRSSLLHLDEKGLPIHGVPWSRLSWSVVHQDDRQVRARLDWTRPELLALFPFPHRAEMTAVLDAEGLLLEVRLAADRGSPLPVSFGFHPYFGLPRSPRGAWRLELPAHHRIELDDRGIPTGIRTARAPSETALGEAALDEALALPDSRSTLAIADDSMRIAVEFQEGFRFAQVFAPANDHCIALEPMTAPTNALVDHRDLTIVPPGGGVRAGFRVVVQSVAPA